MGKEEQVEEREVLDSIFPDEITGRITATLGVRFMPNRPKISPTRPIGCQ